MGAKLDMKISLDAIKSRMRGLIKDNKEYLDSCGEYKHERLDELVHQAVVEYLEEWRLKLVMNDGVYRKIYWG